MQRWEYLWAKVTSGSIDLRFTHDQAGSVQSIYPCDPKVSDARHVRINTDSRAFENWTGSWWLTQLADDGWELVSASSSVSAPGLMTGPGSLVRDLFFRRPIA